MLTGKPQGAIQQRSGDNVVNVGSRGTTRPAEGFSDEAGEAKKLPFRRIEKLLGFGSQRGLG
jgi:hypothetical protein